MVVTYTNEATGDLYLRLERDELQLSGEPAFGFYSSGCSTGPLSSIYANQ